MLSVFCALATAAAGRARHGHHSQYSIHATFATISNPQNHAGLRWPRHNWNTMELWLWQGQGVTSSYKQRAVLLLPAAK